MTILQYKKWLEFWKKLTTGSPNRQIFGAALIVAIGTALVKLAALAKELVVAWTFGTTDTLDAFLIALVIPSFLVNVVANSFNVALIPTYIKVREQEGITVAQRLFSGATVWSLGLLGITTIAMVMTAPLYLPWIAGGFSDEKLDLTFKLLCAIAPMVLLSGMLTIWGAILNAGERFALAAISPIITPAITIILLLLANSWGVFALAAGLVFGQILEIVILGVALKKQHISLMPKWYGFDTHLRQVANQYAPMIAGGFLMCSAGLVDQAMAAQLPSGSVAALNYGNRVIALPITMTTTALSTAVIPYFSKMVACADWTGIRHTLRRYLFLIFLITVPLAAFFYLGSEKIVEFMFQRGTFSSKDTIIVAQIQGFYAWQIPFYVANILLVRLISALQANHILMWGAVINLIVNIVLNYIFIKTLGISGIALSTSFLYVICFSFTSYWCFYLLRRQND
jgi:putative peptidoglycan lipid II flippase